MRVLFVVSSLGLGGAERQVVLQSRELVRRGHAVCIYALNAELDRADELTGSGVALVVDPKRRRLDPAVLMRLRAHARQWRPDVVQGLLYDGNLYSRLACVGLGVRVLNSERSDNYRSTALQRLGYKLSAPWFDGLVANSHSGARFACALHGLDAGRAHVVWNGIDLAEVAARLRSAGQPARAIWPGDGLKRLCMVGAIKPAKDHLLALAVVRRLLDDDDRWRVLFVGDELSADGSGLKAEVLACRDRLGLAPYVRFVGHRRDAIELMADSDVLLMTSRLEGFPNAVLESMACGTPVASTDYSDVRRILPLPWQVAADRSPQTLAGIVERCAEQRAEVSRAQREWVEAHASIAASASALLAVYDQYLGGERALAGGAA